MPHATNPSSQTQTSRKNPNSATGVTNGLFAVTLDFGSGVFTGPDRWLQLDVRTNGNGAFTTLLPRQPILPMPFAIMANTASNLLGTLPAAQLSGTLPSSVLVGYSGTVTLTNGGNSFNGTFSGSFGGNGAGLTSVPGTFNWQNVTVTSQQAQPNTGYLANNAAQVTITLPDSPNLGDIVRVSGVGAGGWIIAQNAGQAIQATAIGINYTNWNTLTNWIQSGASNAGWDAITSSADGTKLAAGIVWWGGGIYTSTNSGFTWTQTSAPTNANWASIASSADGSKLAAAEGQLGMAAPGGPIFTSTNNGTSWTKVTDGRFQIIVSSSDGTKLAATTDYDLIYTSTNSGVTWLQSGAPTTDYWSSIASSSDGTKLAATFSSGGGGIYTSTNSGVTWIQTSAGNAYWSSVASSADGTKLAAVVNSGGIYTSTNSGVTWTQTSAPSSGWYSIASSADGTKLAAAGGNGISTSINSGVTWTQTGAPSSGWYSIASSADGTKLAAVVYGGGIWTAQATIQATTTPGTAGYLTGGQNSAIELQYIGNGQFMPLSYVGPISAY